MNSRNSDYLHLSHNVSNLVYHFVCPAKNRRTVFSDDVEGHLKNICLEIELRYDYIHFLGIGADKNHVHFLVQSLPNYAPSQIIKIIKSITGGKYSSSVQKSRKHYGEHNFGLTDILLKQLARIIMRK